MNSFDYGIIGGGPAGYTAGLNLAKQGFSVVIFEKNKLGGTCLNNGCIPTKSLIHSSEVYKNIKNSDNIGLNIENYNFNFNKVMEKKNSTVEKVRRQLELAVKNAKITTIYANADIKDQNTIIAENIEYKVNNIILATGAKPREIKGLEFDHKFILNSDDILNIDHIPSSILIVGSGAIGTEWARIFKNFGSEITIVEMAEHLIPNADIDVSKRIERIYKQNKIKFYTNDCINKIENKKVTLKSGIEIEPEIILVAIGRIPLEIPNIPNLKILGDSCNEIQLAHYAIHQAKEFTTNIKFDKNLTPAVIYGEPEIAWVGLKEQDIDDTYETSTLLISALGKAWCDDATDGFIKIITKNSFIKGAHIVSKEASSLIHTILLAIQKNITIDELKEICYAHPTYSEGIFELISR